MKRILALTILLMLALTTCAFASPKPLPPANTDADIQFSGFEWYSDYNTTIDKIRDMGIDTSFFVEILAESTRETPHWSGLFDSGFSDSQPRCGVVMSFIIDVPDVAGYKVSSLTTYLMWNPDNGFTENYKEDGKLQFYMAKYDFDVTDTQSCYDDLVKKLKSIYGNNPYSDEYYSTHYTCWINNDKAMVGVSDSGTFVRLFYMAPNAEDKLSEIERIVAKQEIDNAAGDISGL